MGQIGQKWRFWRPFGPVLESKQAPNGLFGDLFGPVLVGKQAKNGLFGYLLGPVLEGKQAKNGLFGDLFWPVLGGKPAKNSLFGDLFGWRASRPKMALLGTFLGQFLEANRPKMAAKNAGFARLGQGKHRNLQGFGITGPDKTPKHAGSA